MNAAWKVRNFLLVQPGPVSVRLTNAEGNQETMNVGRRSKVKLGETIVAWGADLIECLDAQGGLLRAMRLSEETMRSEEPAPPPPVLQMDPEAARLTHFANLLHRAYEHSTDVAFAKLLELVERMDQRTEAIEARLERAEVAYRRAQQDRLEDMWDRAEEAAEKAAEQQEPGAEIVQAFIGGAMQRPPPRKTNGKAVTDD